MEKIVRNKEPTTDGLDKLQKLMQDCTTAGVLRGKGERLIEVVDLLKDSLTDEQLKKLAELALKDNQEGYKLLEGLTI